MTLLSHEATFTAASKFFAKSERLFFIIIIGVGTLVDVYYKTQVAQAESSVLPLPAPVSVPLRNTVVNADPAPITSFPVRTFRWNGACRTDHTGVL